MGYISRRGFLKTAGLMGASGLALTAAQGAFPSTALADGPVAISEDAKNSDECFNEGVEVCTDLLAEGAVLLKNEDGCLPLASGTKLTILGAMSYNYVLGGTGSAGGKDDENTVMMNDALTDAGLDVNSSAWDWLQTQCGGARGTDSGDPSGLTSEGGGFGTPASTWTSYKAIHEYDASVYQGAQATICAAGYTGYVVVTFSRSGAEGASPSMDYDGDGSTLTGSTYLELNQNEKDLLTFCKDNFTHTIVLVNSATPMELGFVDSADYAVDACLWIGHPGEAGLKGVAELLAGTANPSGRLVDTYVYDMTTNPTYYNTDDNRYTNVQITTGQIGMEGQTGNQTFYQYEEGIYLGYRYYETADAEGYFDSSDFAGLSFKNGSVKGYDQVVQFPFGYGMSYTTFEASVASSDVKLAAHGTNTITVSVKNTGSVAGKEVVELYMEAPYQSDTDNFGIRDRGLEKPKVVLVAFAKTDQIEAGSSSEVTLTFKTDDLASFDNFGQGCFVLEKGDYKFNVQADAHHWGEGDDAPLASVSANLTESIIYDESGKVSGATYAGARDSDKQVAKNSMDDVTAGDGNMLEGYLSRSDFAAGMKKIMTHTSDETPNEQVSEAAAEVLNCSGTNTVDYTFSTYKSGVKTDVTETMYAKGANIMPFSVETPDGTDLSGLDYPEWGKTYYVVEGSTDNGLIKVVDSQPSGSYHTLSVDDMADVPIDTEAGLAIWNDLASMTTIDEAVEIQGNSGWNVSAVESVGKPAQVCSDGPGEPANANMANATWFPCAVTIASTWNTALAKAEGVAYGNQAILAGVGGAYAPAMNTHRSPFGGRNFEYYSEDGFIAGMIGGNAVAGIQSTGTNVFIKHCALNDGDTNRGGNCCWANEQAIREIYLRPFEISCKDFGANGIMGSLNRIGLSWFHYGMYVVAMRKEWGWNGFLITDGDGADGDVYNSPQMMLSIDGAILNRGGYINNASTVAAYGDATQYAYGQQCLHDVMRFCLYQYCGSKGTDEEGNTITTTGVTSGSGSGIPTGALVVGGIAAVAVVGGVVALLKRRKARMDEVDVEEDSDQTGDDPSDEGDSDQDGAK